MKNTTMYTALIASACAFALSGCDTNDDAPEARTTQTTTGQSAPRADADNTGNNREDRDRDAMTSMDQSEASEHIKLTADIRRAVMDDDTLSSNAKNCKIITDESGTVWLRGVVESQAEKDRIEQIARRVAGSAIVTSELEIDYD